MDLLKFINNRPFSKELMDDFAQALGVKVKESPSHPTLFLLKYNLIKVDFSHPAALNCRGIILEKDSNKIVCYLFDKFFNYNEGRAAKIDWSTARVQEKLDGSLIKLFWYERETNIQKGEKGRWIIASNGVIDAFEQAFESSLNFGNLFMEAWESTTGSNDIPFHLLDKQFTYILEMLHPLSVIVVQVSKPRIVHLATRRNTFPYDEVSVPLLGVPGPDSYPLFNLKECLDAASKLIDPMNHEGYVVVDANYQRIKIKSPFYVAAHFQYRHDDTPKGKWTVLMRIVSSGEYDENMAYLTDPNAKSLLTELYEAWVKYRNAIFECLKTINQLEHVDDVIVQRKRIAMIVLQKEKTESGLMTIVQGILTRNKSLELCLLEGKDYLSTKFWNLLNSDGSLDTKLTYMSFD